MFSFLFTRGIYFGVIGYFEFSGYMNICIAIRTMLMKGNSIYFQASAVMVHNSDARAEFEKTLNKVRAINHTIDFAENRLL